MKNFKLVVEYDGTQYCGWQRQKGYTSIQGLLEEALLKLTQNKTSVLGASRTDAGVHALGQTCCFKSDTRLPEKNILAGLNSLLPRDIVIRKCEEVTLTFNARNDARGKRYEYKILNSPVPCAVGRMYVWYYKWPLDKKLLAGAVESFRGTHDFKGFMGAGGKVKSTERTIFETSVVCDGPLILIEFFGNGFLKQMVRNMVGTAVNISAGRRPMSMIADALESGDRRKAGVTAPAAGLILKEVLY